jgi:DNA-binding response OmpR family regulator
MSSLRLLIVEDQADLAASIWDYFARRGHLVDHAADGATALRMAMEGRYDTIVLDLGLPRLDGLVVCQRLRAAGRDVRIIMLTARDTLDDKLKGFAEGADDYLVKPFALKELEARIGVLARAGAANGAVVSACGLELDTRGFIARREGHAIPLTRMQGLLLECLIRRSPAVVGKQELLSAAWSGGSGDAAALHTHIFALRAALDKPFATRLIHSVHGVGYRFGDRP